MFLENLRLQNLMTGTTIHTKNYLKNLTPKVEEIQFLTIPKEELI